ncbi:MAG: hypothetical protein U5N55_11990 [Cypionkella sp.]|nr:hypothetical protein [Cypionkella sp.]
MATAIALEKLSGKVDDLATEMGDQFELRREAAHAFELAVVQRLSALESNVKSLERERK